MSLNPYRPGDFVWSNYPQRENPARPGPRHVGYVALSTGSDTDEAVWLAFTTSQPWVGSRPPGVYSVGRDAATCMGQPKPFTLDLRRVANVPVTTEWFPIAAEKALPFEPLVPNAETVEAMKAARRSDLVSVCKPAKLLASLNADC